ncbi:hypothetical protein Lser_V15G22752 [Lactuca serriola]
MRLVGEQPHHLLRSFIASPPFAHFLTGVAGAAYPFPSDLPSFLLLRRLPPSHVCFDVGSGKVTVKEGSSEIDATPPHDCQPVSETPIVRLARFFPS